MEMSSSFLTTLQPPLAAAEETNSLVGGDDTKPVVLQMERLHKATDVAHAAHHAHEKAADATYAKLVWVRIEFIQFGEVDTFNEKYQAEVKIRAKWYDEDIDQYDRDKHWYPKLYIENAMHDVKEEVSYHVTRLDGEGGKVMVTETRVAKGSFWER